MELKNYSLVDAEGIIGDWSPEDMEMVFKLTGATGVEDMISDTQAEIDNRASKTENLEGQTLSLINGVAFLKTLLQPTQ